MRVIGSELTDTDITNLLGLRSARVRQALSPAVPTDTAERLHTHGYVRSHGGGVEITDQGLRYLKGWFLFCEAPGCDGVLRHWKLLSPMHAGKLPEDPPLEHEHIDGRPRLTIACRKCAHRNVLRGNETPTRGADYVIIEVLPPRAATAA
jgi:hypothetical protein